MTVCHTSILLTEKDIDRFKMILSVIKKKYSNITFPSPKVGKLGRHYLIALKYEEDVFKTAIEAFVYNDIKILLPDEKTIELIYKIKAARIQTAVKKNDDELDQYTPVYKEVTPDTVDEMVLLGDYRSIIDITKDIKNKNDIVEVAESNLHLCINRAIDIAVLEAKSDKALIKRSIKKLLEIASDKKLKSLNITTQLKRAGIEAVKLCAADRDTVKSLIDIANNNRLHNEINIKAALKFQEIVFANKIKYKNEIDSAVKKLNIRWLNIAFDVVENSFTDLERSQLNSLADELKLAR